MRPRLASLVALVAAGLAVYGVVATAAGQRLGWVPIVGAILLVGVAVWIAPDEGGS